MVLHTMQSSLTYGQSCSIHWICTSLKRAHRTERHSIEQVFELNYLLLNELKESMSHVEAWKKHV